MSKRPTYSDLEQKLQALENKVADLEMSEKHFRSIFEAAENVGFILSDAQEPMPCIQEFSPGAEKIFGYNRSEVIGEPFSILHLLESKPDYKTIHRRMKENGKGQSYMNENFQLHKSGRKISTLSSSHPLFDAKKNLNAVLVLYIDLTEQKRLEAQLRQSHKIEALGTLAGGIAHDFNNILGIIIGNAELALMDLPVWHQTKRHLDEIHKASIRARDLISQILTFSRQTVQGLHPIQISPIIKESINLLRASIPSNIKIRGHFPTELDTVFVNASQINQVLINLCANAAQAMKKAGGILDISLDNVEFDDEGIIKYPDLRPGRYLKLTVKDTGHGIDPKDMPHIFDPYFTTKGLANYSGMGLSVVHGIIQNHNGAIIASSELGQGSIFEVFLPCVKQTSKVLTDDEKSESLSGGNERILFIDDEEAIITFEKELLEHLGYNVTIEQSPSNALKIFRGKPEMFDLVITDMTMPEMTGVDLARELKRIRKDIPIILCTGYSDLIDEKKAKDMGIAAYIMKPIVMKNLAKILRNVLDEKKPD